MDTLNDLLPEIARLGEREAVRWSNGFRTWVATYSELYGAIGAIAAYFDERGIRKGDRVMIWGQNRMEWVAAFWACVARGAEAVPVDYRFSPDLVRRIQAESKPKLLVDEPLLDTFAGLPAQPRFQSTPVTPDDVVEIVYTSGTTGEPKGVVHRHRNLCSNLRPFRSEIAKYARWARPFQPIRILDLLPLSHMFGQSQGLFIPLLLGGAVVFTSEIHPAKIIELVHDHRISVIVSVPRILENLKNEVSRQFAVEVLYERPGGHRRFPQILRRWWRYRRIHSRFGFKFWAFVVGGARVDPELEQFWSLLGFAVVQGYGLTEASPVVAVNHPFNARAGSLGKVVPGQDVMIAPDGEILVRGESVTTTSNGWLHTGDLGEIDSEGRLYFRGRKKDMIVTADGLNVHPEDVEAVLNHFPEVRQSAVVGVQANGGEEVHAALILNDPSIDPGELIRRANRQLEAHQRIRGWTVWQGDDFPRTASTLKVKRHEVARRLGAAKAEAPSQPQIDLSAMSSLERVELLSELEDRYQLELDEDAFAKLTSTRELEDWLRKPDVAAAPAEREAALSEWARSYPVRGFRAVFQHIVAMPLFRHYLPLTVTGLENLDGVEPPVIFAANHVSHLDVPAIFTALPHRWHQRLAPAMMKDHFRAYFEPRGYSWKEIGLAAVSYFLACAIYNAYPLPKQMSGTRQALRYTGDLIDRGFCPIVFPEGLRTPDGQIHAFRPGIGMMALRLRAPIVPVRLEGLYELYPSHEWWPRRGPVHVAIGRPMSFAPGVSYEDAAHQLEETIRQMGG
jgi:long-chain acyl-CoA synthetase